MATHSSFLAWRIPRTEEPGGLLSMGSHRIGHDWSDLACLHALKKEMATHSSVLAWRIPWTEEPGGLLSMGSHRIGHDWSDLACLHALEKEIATHSSVLAWRIPGTGEPGGLPSMGLHRVRHDWSDLAAAAENNRYRYINIQGKTTKNIFPRICTKCQEFHFISYMNILSWPKCLDFSIRCYRKTGTSSLVNPVYVFRRVRYNMYWNFLKFMVWIMKKSFCLPLYESCCYFIRKVYINIYVCLAMLLIDCVQGSW